MALEIKWSKKADRSFDAIIDYLEGEFGEMTTSKFVRKVHEFLGLLSEFPELGTEEYQELNIRGIVIVKQITLFYKVRNQKIILLNFYDNRQRPKKKRY